MSDEMKVQAKGLNKKFLVAAIALIAVGLIAALVLLVPASGKAKKVEEQLNLGAKYLSELNYEQAIVAYEAVIKIDPKCEEAYLALVDVYIATGELDKAEEVLKRAEEALGSDATDAVSDKKKEVTEVQEEQEKAEVSTSTPIEDSEKEAELIPSPTEVPVPTEEVAPTMAPQETLTPIPLTVETERQAYELKKTDEIIYTYGVEYPVFGGEASDTLNHFIIGLTDEFINQGKEYSEQIEQEFVTGGAEFTSEDPWDISQTIEFTGEDTVWANFTVHTVAQMGSYGSYTEEREYAVNMQDGSIQASEPTVILIPTPTPTMAPTPESTATSTVTPSPSPTPTATPSPSPTPTATPSPSPTPTVTPSPTPTVTSSPSPTPTVTPSPKPTQVIVLNWENVLDYRVEDNQTVTIVKLSNTELKEVMIPNGIDGYPVCKIGRSAFENCTNLTKVELPDNLVEIEGWAFSHCSNLTQLELPDGLRVLGEHALYWCDSLEQLIIPGTVERIEEGALRHNSLKEIIVDENNAAYIAKDGALFDKDMKTLLCVSTEYDGREYRIPDGVTRIGNAAFDGCKMEIIHIPESLQQIGEMAFWNCHNLKELTIPKNVSEIGEYISAGGRQIAFLVDGNNMHYCAENGILFNKEMSELICFGDTFRKGKYEVPESVEKIAAGAFYACWLTDIILPESIIEIGGAAFSYCNLTTVDLPNGLKQISTQMFGYCDGLERIVVPDKVTEIGWGAFSDCKNLKEVVIPASVTQIAINAFEGSESVVIYTSAGSYAEQWAKDNGISVVIQ